MPYPYHYAPDSKVLGLFAQSIIYNLRYDDVKDIIMKYGLDNIRPDEYYPVDDLVNVLVEISKTSGFMSFVAIGMAAAGFTPLPEAVDNLPLLEKLAMPVYAANNQAYEDNIVPGVFTFHTRGDRHIVYHHGTVWPDGLMYGSIYYFAKKFLAEEYNFKVEYDGEIPRMGKGGDKTLIHLTWEEKGMAFR